MHYASLVWLKIRKAISRINTRVKNSCRPTRDQNKKSKYDELRIVFWKVRNRPSIKWTTRGVKIREKCLGHFVTSFSDTSQFSDPRSPSSQLELKTFPTNH